MELNIELNVELQRLDLIEKGEPVPYMWQYAKAFRIGKTLLAEHYQSGGNTIEPAALELKQKCVRLALRTHTVVHI